MPKEYEFEVASLVSTVLITTCSALPRGYSPIHDDHNEDPMLTAGELAGLICGVLLAALCLTILILCLVKHFDPRAWKRITGCMVSLVNCNLDGPEHPDEPVKARDPDEPRPV